jgi:hypothetical protein
MVDADISRFGKELHHTRHGLRLRLAMHEMNIAMRQIERLRFLGSRSADAIETWQQAYIKASDRASQAIDALWDDYGWPMDGARARDFIYRNKKGLNRP